ncbi:1393_t:CDS:2, partial [Rhizophagus irregularis]
NMMLNTKRTVKVMFLRKAVDVYTGKNSATLDNPISTSTYVPMTDSDAESNTTPKLNKFLQFQKRVCL